MVLMTTRPPPGPGDDPTSPTRIVHIHIGEHYVSGQPALEIHTVLGSCIGACIRDPKLRIGGMNHFMLPGDGEGRDFSRDGGGFSELRYGQHAMERLINDLLAAGGRRERLEVKLFGGANTLHAALRVGDRNVSFVRRFMAEEGMQIAAEDLGGAQGRRVRYNPTTGQVMRLRLEPSREHALFSKELDFSKRAAPTEGTVELFE